MEERALPLVQCFYMASVNGLGLQGVLMRYLGLLGILLLSGAVNASPVGDCEGMPEEAITELPSPLSQWGVIVCTPYGHIISNKEGWIWSNPAAYSPVMIPSQMVRNNPEPLGNKSYFTRIEMTPIKGDEANASIKLIEPEFGPSEEKPKIYRLEVRSVSGNH